MEILPAQKNWFERRPSFGYVAPFVCLLVIVGISVAAKWNPMWQAPITAVILAAVTWLCWPAGLELRLADTTGGALVGVTVFLIWIAPDIFVPGYRTLPLFHNDVVGHLRSSMSPKAVQSGWFLGWRSLRAVLLGPIAEELFWRGWLMRWLISWRFEDVRIGKYASGAFWTVAVLFAAEHGPYWDVGFVAGILYNWWAVKTGSMADLIWTHAVTNACLSAYVIAMGAWQYWQ